MKTTRKSCHKATYLLSKKEEGKLSMRETIALQLHLKVCSMCRLFKIQTDFIGRNARNEGMTITLSDKIKNQLKEQMKS